MAESKKSPAGKASTAKSASKPVAKVESKPAAKAASAKTAVKSAEKAAEKAIENAEKAFAPIASAVKSTLNKVAAKVDPKSLAKDVQHLAKDVQNIANDAKKAVEKVAQKSVSKPAPKASGKASTKPSGKVSPEHSHSISPEYLVSMQKDPNWLQAFWGISEQRVQEAIKGGGKLVLRLYDVAADLTVRAHRNRQFRDFEVPANARSWYIQNGSQSGQCALSLGSVNASGEFAPLVDSSKVACFGSNGQFLGEGDDLFLRASLGGVGPGGFKSSQLGLSSQMSLPWTSSLAGSSAAPSSWASSASGASWSLPPNVGKDFFLWVKTRLIVYGGTRPDAHLQVRGEPFPLNPDGTFSFEQDLPDSTQIIPVFATDKDGDFPTTIIPIVIKRTE